jgi:hypothetical protein
VKPTLGTSKADKLTRAQVSAGFIDTVWKVIVTREHLTDPNTSGPMFEASVAIRCVVFPAADLSRWVGPFAIQWNITDMTTGRCTISGGATGQNAVTRTGEADKRSRAISHRRSLLNKPVPHRQRSDKASPESATGSDRTRVAWTLAESIEKHADE